MRYNPLKGEWVLVSPHRLKRPWKGQVCLLSVGVHMLASMISATVSMIVLVNLVALLILVCIRM